MTALDGARVGGLWRETLQSLRGQKIAVLMIGLLVAAMSATIVITTARASAAAEQVNARVEAAGSRQLVITDPSGADLVAPATIAVLGNASSVQAAAGIGITRDVTNGALGPGGSLAPAWSLIADFDRIATLTAGRWPRDGEAVITTAAQRTLGLDVPLGYLMDKQGRTYPVVGSYRPAAGFDDINGAIIAQTHGGTPTLRVVITDVAYATETQRLALDVLNPPRPADLRITSPTALAELQQDVSADLARYARVLTMLTIGSGALLIAIVVLSQVLLQRKDIGRRRALGAPRWAVITLILGQTTIPAAAGAGIGCAAALWYAHRTGTAPNPTLAAAAFIIGILAAAVAALVPAALAAWRDPVRVLRTA